MKKYTIMLVAVIALAITVDTYKSKIKDAENSIDHLRSGGTLFCKDRHSAAWLTADNSIIITADSNGLNKTFDLLNDKKLLDKENDRLWELTSCVIIYQTIEHNSTLKGI